MQLDEEKLEALRSWGDRLRQTGGEEYAAVGRAILLLVEEIDRLHIELWHARMQPSAQVSAPAEVPAETTEEAVTTSLRARVQQVLRREAAAAPAEQSEAENKGATGSSAEAWIAALRRQK